MDRATRKWMQNVTAGYWWPSRAYPRRHIIWSGVINELDQLAREALSDEARANYAYLARLARQQAHADGWAQY